MALNDGFTVTITETKLKDIVWDDYYNWLEERRLSWQGNELFIQNILSTNPIKFWNTKGVTWYIQAGASVTITTQSLSDIVLKAVWWNATEVYIFN